MSVVSSRNGKALHRQWQVCVQNGVMRDRALILAIMFGLYATHATAQDAEDRAMAAARTLQCHSAVKEEPCKWRHGRLGFSNGTPAFRLWEVGTHHLYGIFTAPGAEQVDDGDNEQPRMPDFTPKQERLWGDFLVCPIEPFQEGAMQMACIKDSKKLFKERF